ncbi:hypothetical protein L7F22_040258 [Adiantum nelumboides]|nr:hypothetical protein [Adiantum nelumboides]
MPQPTTEVPRLPHDGVERAMNVIRCEDKGEEKIMEAEAMPGKKATIAEEPSQMTTNDGANKKKKKRKQKASMTRRKIGIINFPLRAKSKTQDLIEEVQRQGPKLTWPQLLHLSPRMWRQWSRMVLETVQQAHDVPFGSYFEIHGRWTVTTVADSLCVVDVKVGAHFNKWLPMQQKIRAGSVLECTKDAKLIMRLAGELLSGTEVIALSMPENGGELVDIQKKETEGRASFELTITEQEKEPSVA